MVITAFGAQFPRLVSQDLGTRQERGLHLPRRDVPWCGVAGVPLGPADVPAVLPCFRLRRSVSPLSRRRCLVGGVLTLGVHLVSPRTFAHEP